MIAYRRLIEVVVVAKGSSGLGRMVYLLPHY